MCTNVQIHLFFQWCGNFTVAEPKIYIYILIKRSEGSDLKEEGKWNEEEKDWSGQPQWRNAMPLILLKWIQLTYIIGVIKLMKFAPKQLNIKFFKYLQNLLVWYCKSLIKLFLHSAVMWICKLHNNFKDKIVNTHQHSSFLAQWKPRRRFNLSGATYSTLFTMYLQIIGFYHDRWQQVQSIEGGPNSQQKTDANYII